MSSWENLGHDLSDQREIGSTEERRPLSENRPTSSDVCAITSSHPFPQSSTMIQGSYHPCNFRVRLDVRQFMPNEVKIYQNGEMIAVCGKHQENSAEHGFISREFTRKYQIPADVDPEKMTCVWHPDNVLIIKAPRDSRTRELDGSFEHEPLPSSIDNNPHLEI